MEGHTHFKRYKNVKSSEWFQSGGEAGSTLQPVKCLPVSDLAASARFSLFASEKRRPLVVKVNCEFDCSLATVIFEHIVPLEEC